MGSSFRLLSLALESSLLEVFVSWMFSLVPFFQNHFSLGIHRQVNLDLSCVVRGYGYSS